MQQWLLARPEFREFLPTRPMVAYPERWMDRVDAMKRLQGWTDVSVRCTSATWRSSASRSCSRSASATGATSSIREQAGNWARYWRPEIQWYIHAYQAVTGVDLSADMADVRQAEQARARALPPALHLQRRLVEQRRASNGAMRHPVEPPRGQRV